MRWDKNPLCGNEAAQAALHAMIDTGHLPHALLVEGEEGTGRRTLARYAAAAALCEGDKRPCGACSACRKIAARCHPDVEEIVGSGARSLHVDEIRALRRHAYVRPNEASGRVFLVTGAECMTEQAQNALLKVLEEPPANVYIFLTCVSASGLIPPLVSRCARVGLLPPEGRLALAYLRARLECGDASPERLEEMLKLYGNRIGKVLEAFAAGEDSAAAKAETLAAALADAAGERHIFSLLQLCAGFERDRALQKAVADALISLYWDCCRWYAGGAALSGAGAAAARAAARLTPERAEARFLAVQKIRDYMEQNANGSLALSCLCGALWEYNETD